jgi:hypothetical protein
MTMRFSLHPSLSTQGVFPVDDKYWYNIPVHLGVDLTTDGNDARDWSDYYIKWDLDNDGEFDDFTYPDITTKASINPDVAAALGWDVSGVHQVNGL